MKKRVVRLVVVIAILLLPVVAYVLEFHTNQISDNPADWGSFGDYIGGVYGVIVALLACFISFRLEDHKERLSHCRAAAEQLFKQIHTIKNDNYRLDSCTKLMRLAHQSELYLSKRLISQVTSLADYYMRHRQDNEIINESLEEDTLNELKRIYDR